jgi:hypothetical protein
LMMTISAMIASSISVSKRDSRSRHNKGAYSRTGVLKSALVTQPLRNPPPQKQMRDGLYARLLP